MLNRNHRLTCAVGTKGNMSTNTIYYVTARTGLWKKHPAYNGAFSYVNRMLWNPTNVVELCATPAGSGATPLGMGVWAGNHARGHANLELTGSGHFVVFQKNVFGGVAWSITNGQHFAWNATVDGESELFVACHSPGEATLSLCYTNANAVGVSYNSNIKFRGFEVGVKPDMNTNGVVNAVDYLHLAQNRAANTPVDVFYQTATNVFHRIDFTLADAPVDGQQHVILQGDADAFRLYASTNPPLTHIASSTPNGTVHPLSHSTTTNNATTTLWLACRAPSTGAIHHVYGNINRAVLPGTNTLTIATDKVIAEPINWFPYNPAGLPLNTNAIYFLRLMTFNQLFKDHITWSNTTDNISIEGSNIGTNVTVKANTAGDSGLTAKIMNLQLPTLFNVKTFTLSDVNVIAYIVSNDVTAAWTPTTVNNFVSKGNPVLHLGGVNLVVTSIQYVTNTNWYDMANTSVGWPDMARLPLNGNNLRMIFVNTIGGATGFDDGHRIVISTNANHITLAHETLHACGVPDIYEDKGGHNIFVSWGRL